MSGPRSVGAALSRLRSVVRQVVGVPDFEHYLEHRRRCHPGEPTLSEAEFHARALQHRYGAGRPGCC